MTCSAGCVTRQIPALALDVATHRQRSDVTGMHCHCCIKVSQGRLRTGGGRPSDIAVIAAQKDLWSTMEP